MPAPRHRHRDPVSTGAAPSPMALAARPASSAAELITLSEAARVAGVHRDTVRAWCARGDLPSLRQGPRREVRLRRGDLLRLLGDRDQKADGHKAGTHKVLDGIGTSRPLRPLRGPGGTSTDTLRRLAYELSASDAVQPG